MSVYTEFGALREIIVGNVQNYNLEKIDVTFKLAYGENLKNSPFDNYTDYKVDKQKITERTEDLDNFARILEDRGIVVKRPEILESFNTFKIPYNPGGVLSSMANPRDMTFIYGKKIIHTPPMSNKRYFENFLSYKLFLRYFIEGYIWFSAPNPLLYNERIDLSYWKNERDFRNFNKSQYDISFDAANCVKIGKDILFNISSYNHELGSDWLQSVLGDDIKVHKIYQLDDNHIDGKLSVLRPGLFLVNNSIMSEGLEKYLPEKFRKWEIIYTSDFDSHKEEEAGPNSNYLSLCSLRGSQTNVLSIDENTVCVLDSAVDTIKCLIEKGFDVIPVRLRHCEIFGGGIHCATLDVKRDDDMIDYTLM